VKDADFVTKMQKNRKQTTPNICNLSTLNKVTRPEKNKERDYSSFTLKNAPTDLIHKFKKGVAEKILLNTLIFKKELNEASTSEAAEIEPYVPSPHPKQMRYRFFLKHKWVYNA
jgi:hypothetical protein